MRVAAFACAKGDAWHSAQGILQAQGVGVLDDLLGDYGNRAWGVHQRRGVLLRGGLFDLVIGAGLFRLAIDAGGIEGDGAVGSRIGGVGGRSAQGDADGGHDQAWRTHCRWHVLTHCYGPSPRCEGRGS
ncbi:hypothetical protein D3C73_1241940 [compost metagenome]